MRLCKLLPVEHLRRPSRDAPESRKRGVRARRDRGRGGDGSDHDEPVDFGQEAEEEEEEGARGGVE